MTSGNVEKLLEDMIAGFKPGSLVKGKVVRVTGEEIVIDIEYKSEGVVSTEEFNMDVSKIIPGQGIDIVVESLNPDARGFIPLSKEKADMMLNWTKVEEFYKEDRVIEGVIFRSIPILRPS